MKNTIVHSRLRHTLLVACLFVCAALALKVFGPGGTAHGSEPAIVTDIWVDNGQIMLSHDAPGPVTIWRRDLTGEWYVVVSDLTEST